MDATLTNLGLATLAFVGGHFVLSSAPVRGPAAGTRGEPMFRGFYSLLMIAALVWMIDAYRFAAHVKVWDAGVVAEPVMYVFMFFAAIFFVCSVTTRNPTLAGMDMMPGSAATSRGIYAVTRHPMLAAIALWAAGHLLVRGTAAGLLFFGGMFVLAAGGMAHIDARRRAKAAAGNDPDWASFEAGTSRAPFRAILEGRARLSLGDIGWLRILGGIVLFAAMLYGHGPVVGLYLVPIGM